MKITVEESPYGDTGAVYDGMLGMMNHFVLQLKSFRKLKKTPDERKALEDDIAGYEEILKSNSQKNANAFMKAKGDQFKPGNVRIFKNNLDVIDHLKKIGEWDV